MQKAPTANFAAICAKKAPNATCRCIVAKLAATIDGNFIMETAAVNDRYPEGAPQSAMLAVINRYDLTYPEFQAIAARANATIGAAGRGC